ncbi:hypothetical protein [Paludisphaera rhizosphaerae]|uniref:hypothetical protein n=1 Tax=Paludisphaera rhizosphaerae TaxID=2711216 RepID=UPI0013EB709D|nr:hypothetical protein [Paludisphaera rhizosphaerae]
MVRHESNESNRPLSLEAFAAAYDEVERTMLVSEEMQLEGCPIEPHVTAVGRALRVACRLASGRPGWKLFTKPCTIDAGSYRVTLTPSDGDYFEEEVLTLHRVGRLADQVEDPDDDRPLVASYYEPRKARELARYIETSLLDGFGLRLSGGVVLDGAIFTVELQDEVGATTIVVMPSDSWLAIQDRRGRGDQTPCWLDAEEVALIESHRAASRPQGGASGAVGPRFNPASN